MVTFARAAFLDDYPDPEPDDIRAIPQRLAHLRRRPKVMMRPHHSTEPRLLLGQHRTERHLESSIPSPDAAPVQETCTATRRKSTPKRIRLEIQEPNKNPLLLHATGRSHRHQQVARTAYAHAVISRDTLSAVTVAER